MKMMKNIFKIMNEIMNMKKMENMNKNEKKMEKMNKGIENLKNLKSLMQIFAESANSADSAKQIFATFATFAMSIFSVIANIANIAMQIFKRSSVATLRTVPVKSTVKVAQKSRITRSLPAFAMTLTFLFTVVGGFSTRAWGENVAETTTQMENKSNSVTANGVTFSKTGNLRTEAVFNRYMYLKSGESITLSWSGVPANHTINVTKVEINKNREASGTKCYYNTSKKSDTDKQFGTDSGWNISTLGDADYFGLGNSGSVTIKAVDNVLQYKEIKFTYTIGNNYSIHFNGNGSTSGSMSNLSMAYYVAKNLTANAYTRSYAISYNAGDGELDAEPTSANTASSYTFEGWATTPGGTKAYNDGQSVQNLTDEVNEVVDLYAKWSGGGVTLPTGTRDGYFLAGWNKGGVRVGRPGETYYPEGGTSAITLVADWQENITPEFDGDGAEDVMKVGSTYTGFSFSNTSTSKPTNNSDDVFYYIIDNIDVNDHVEGCASGKEDSVISYNPSTNTLTALNAGTADITFYHKAVPASHVVASSTTFSITVEKYSNTISCNWDGWSKTANFDEEIGVTFSSNNDTGTPIVVTPGAGVAAGNGSYDAVNHKVVAGHNVGSASWTISQAEDYKYQAAVSKTLTVTVGTLPSPNCLLVENDNQTQTIWHGETDHEHTWTAENAAGTITYEISKNDGLGMGYNVQQLIGSSWENLTDYKDDYTTSWGDWKTETLDRSAKGVRIRAKGGSLTYVRNVTVSRLQYIETSNSDRVEIDELNMPVKLNTGSATSATFYVDYSTCDNVIKLGLDNPHITFANGETTYQFETDDSGRKAITLTYNSAVVEDIEATVTIYTRYEHQTLTVNAETVTKHTPTISWTGTKEFEVGDVIANGFTVVDENEDPIEGGTWSFVSKNEEVIKIVDGKIVAQELDEDTKTAKIVGTLTAGEYDNFVTGSSEDITLTVKRKDNVITVSGASETMLMDDTMSDISVSSTNSALGGYRITSAPSADKAVFDLEAGTITSKNYKETMNWTIHQDADGTYKEAEYELSVEVVSAPEDDSKKIYIYEQTPADTEVSPKLLGENWWEVKNVAKKVWFQARGINNGKDPDMQPKQYVEGSSWINAGDNIKGSLKDPNPYATTHSRDLNRAATGCRFDTTQTKALYYVRNVKVECYSYLRSNVYNDNPGSVNITTQADGTTPVYVNKEGVGTITIYYGIANGGDLKLMCNNPKFTFGERHATELTLVEDKDLPKSGKVQLNVYYTSEAAGDDVARVVVYNQVYYHEITLRGTTVELEPAAKAVTVAEDADWKKDIDATTPVEVTGTNITVDEEIEVYSLNISSGTTLTITPTGGLTVGAGGVTIGGEAKSAGKLVLQAITPESESESGERGQTAYIRFAPEYEEEMPEATIELYSVGYKDVLGGSGADYWQYVGVPVDVKDYAAKTAFPKSLVQSWHEDQGRWVNDRSTLKLKPFVGYATSQYRNEDGYKMVFEGQLAQNRGVVKIDLDYTEDATHNLKGWNMIANSFAAPIDITRLTVEDFDGADATIYLWDSRANDYVEIPVESLDKLSEDIQRVIPSMQAFFVHTNEATKLTLDYNRLVWRGTQENMPLKVQKAVDVAVTGRMQITMIDAFGKDELYLLESNSYDKAYENGYDAPKKAVAGRSAIYAIEDRELAVDATDDMRGTKIGIRAGEVDSCQLVFTNVESDHALYFVDNMTGDMYFIEEGKTITLKYIDQDFEGRFEIVGSHNNHDVSTGVDGQKDEKITTKYIKDNTVYILKNGLKYNSLGQRVQ